MNLKKNKTKKNKTKTKNSIKKKSKNTKKKSKKARKSNTEYPKLIQYHLEKALELNKGHYKAHALLGEFFLAWSAIDFKSYKKAIHHLNTSLKIEYNQPRTHMYLGYTFKQINKHDQAVNCFQNAINVDPNYIDPYIELGQIFHIKKDSLAVIYYDNALRLSPNNIIAL